MSNALFTMPRPWNEPVLAYRPGSPERAALDAELARQAAHPIEIPLRIGGAEVRTGKTADNRAPHNRKQLLCTYHLAGEKEAQAAIDAAMKAWETWSRLPYTQRAAVFLRAADLLATKYRHAMNARIMLCQSKNPYQAEIDNCELIDFWRFNVHYMEWIYQQQPLSPKQGEWNRLEYRPLEGFVFAVTPFNFLSIGGNLPTAPAIMGNVALWKPASTTVYSNELVMDILREAGLPDGVVTLIPGPGRALGPVILKNKHLAGVHFTGSTETFNGMWRTVAENMATYRGYPRMVGETGGKDFVMVHPSADPAAVAVALLRGSFEYQGQKCSAASRAYVPESLWDAVRTQMARDAAELKPGDPVKGAFFNAVIDEESFDKLAGYIDRARKDRDQAEIVFGGGCDKREGFFIEPTLIRCRDPRYVTMQEELFGPVMSVYVYKDSEWEKTLALCDQTSPYALTGAVFARDRQAVQQAEDALRHAAGNFYINDKPTGAVVGQQPFGGARASGTNDKAGSYLNMLRWASPRAIKENLNPPTDYRYPFMG